MAITYIYEPTGEKVDKVDWRWVAVYNDGTVLEQYELRDGQAFFHRFAEIDQSKLADFLMVHDTLATVTLRFDPATMKLIHFYRNQILHVRLHDGIHQEQRKERLYYFGYEQDGVKHLTGLLPNGKIIVSNDPDHFVEV